MGKNMRSYLTEGDRDGKQAHEMFSIIICQGNAN